VGAAKTGHFEAGKCPTGSTVNLYRATAGKSGKLCPASEHRKGEKP
jgi:hypothetical protein